MNNENLKWYAVNFSNEQVIQGQSTQFLRFQNRVANIDTIDKIGNERVWVLPIPEIVGVDMNDESYRDQVYFNGADVFEIQRLFKDYYGTSNYNNNDFFIYGGPTDSNTPADFKTQLPGSVELELASGTPTYWVGTPLNGPSTSTRSPLEKLNFRIDYTGNLDVVVKITFIITTANPGVPGFFDVNRVWPIVLDDPNDPRVGDVYQNGSGVWQVFDGDEFEDIITNETGFNPVYGIKHLHEMGYFMPGSDKTSVWLDYQESYLFCYKSKDKDTSRDKDYWIDKPISDATIHDDMYSYALMRTNPRLSGNIKIVVDTKNNMYMDSIEANNELSNAKYKKNKISPHGSFAVDVNRIFGTLSPEILYDIKQRDDQYLNTKQTYGEQYDFFYGYGATHLNSKYYEERNRIFAPLWIRKKLPEFFVIFKVPGSVNTGTYTNASNADVLTEMLSTASIVNTYDLRDGSNLGTYLRKITEDKRFEEQPIRISYEQDTLSTYFGVSYKDGIMSEKGEYLHNLFTSDHAINEFEEIITDGYMRNGMISANLMNLEFLFDDPSAGAYDINRYFGLYVNEIDLAKLELDPDMFRYIDDQRPLPSKSIDAEPYSLRPFTQSNNNGVILPINKISGTLPTAESVEDYNRFFFIKDRNDKLQRIKSISEHKIPDYDEGKPQTFSGIQLYNDVLNISDYTGTTRLSGEYDTTLLNSGSSQLVVNFNDVLLDGEILEIEWIGHNKEKQLWQCIVNSNGLQPGDAWDYPQYNPDTSLYTNAFSAEGSNDDAARAFATCLNMFENRVFSAWADGNKVYIKADTVGDIGNNMNLSRKLLMNSKLDAVNFYDVPSVLYNSSYEFTSNSILSFNETSPVSYNNYEIEILDISPVNIEPVYVKMCLRRNGGKLTTHTQIISDNNDHTFIYSGNNVEIEFSNNALDYTKGDKIQFTPSDNIISQTFIGGASRNRSRATVNNEDSVNIKPDHWFQTQKSSYSRLIKWNVQGVDVFMIPNLENVQYDEHGSIIGYDKYKEESIIQVNRSSQSFYPTTMGKVVSVETYKPSVGMLSFIPVKDFDFDWISSDYAYSPNIETIKYFDDIVILKGESTELSLNNSYKIEQGKVVLEGWDESLDRWVDIILSDSDIYTGQVEYSVDKVASFNTYLPNYYYETTKLGSDKKGVNQTPGITNHFYRNYKQLTELSNFSKLRVTATEDAIISLMSYDMDINLAEFNGFLGLSDFFSIQDEEELEDMIRDGDTSRFYYDHLVSEYDRLRENFNKDYAVKSRVVPYINKWVQRGTDCRDNKYRLNNSMAFGVTNFSPDTHIRDQNERLHTHEFYYLDNIPDNYPSDILSNSRSYFFDKLSCIAHDGLSWYELFKDNTNDWFSKYFTVGYPTETSNKDGNIKLEASERYVFTDFVPGDETVQGIFRGGKFKILDIDQDTGNIIEGSKKYVNYKFASILQIKRLSINMIEPPSEFEFIANHIHKTIVLVITLYVSDYRIESGYDYLFLYAGEDALRSTDVLNINHLHHNSPNSPKYSSTNYLNGYGIQRHFNEFQGGTILSYADIKLNGIFNTKTSDVVSNNNVQRTLRAITVSDTEFIPVEEIFPVDGSDYDIHKEFNNNGYSFTQLDVMERGSYSELSQYITGMPVHSPLRHIVNNQPGAHGNSIDIDTNSVVLYAPFNPTYTTAGRTNTSSGFPTRRVASVPGYNISNKMTDTTCWYLSGGKGYINRRLKDISYGEILNKINNDSNSVKYYSITEEGIKEGGYKLELIDFDRIDKVNRLHVLEDIDKPDVFQNLDTIGFDLSLSTDNETIYRHRGRFEPKTRNVLTFWAREGADVTDNFNTDYLLSNTRWATNIDSFGIINNLYYSKISDNSLMKISTSSKHKSLYPLINEVAIDNKDYFVFNSNWDNNYYDYYTTKGGELTNKGGKSHTTISKEGTLELKEQSAFFGSKIMMTPNKITVDTFTEAEVIDTIIKGLESVDNKSLGNSSANNKLPESKSDRLVIDILTDDILVRKMIEDGAANEFIRLRDEGVTRFSGLSDKEITENIRSYIIKNILPLYVVSEVVLYTNDTADEVTDDIVQIALTNQQKRAEGFKINKNANVNNKTDGVYQIIEQLTYNKYKSYSISVIYSRL